MSELRIRDVMNPSVIAVTADCTYQHIVDVITDLGVGGMPVVSDDNRVTGVISEADLLPKVQPDAGAAGGRRHRAAADTRRKAGGQTAGELMTSPAVTIRAGASIGAAARLMERHRVKRLPVLDDETGTLVGIVTRRDLLSHALRGDEAIERDVMEQVLLNTQWLDPLEITAEVHDGVVTLGGTADRRSTATHTARQVRTLEGVTGVVDEIACQVEDEPADRPRVLDAELR